MIWFGNEKVMWFCVGMLVERLTGALRACVKPFWRAAKPRGLTSKEALYRHVAPEKPRGHATFEEAERRRVCVDRAKRREAGAGEQKCRYCGWRTDGKEAP